MQAVRFLVVPEARALTLFTALLLCPHLNAAPTPADERRHRRLQTLADPSTQNGVTFFAWADPYCFRVIVGPGGTIHQNEQGGGSSSCNAAGFSSYADSYFIGTYSTGDSTSQAYTNGASCGSVDRSATLRFYESASVSSTTLATEEPSMCSYVFSITGVAGCFTGNSCPVIGGVSLIQNPVSGGSSGGATGDPHMYGIHGDRYDFKGQNNTFYNFLSSSNLSLAVLFEHDTFRWRRKRVHGSWMKAVAITAHDAETNQTIRFGYDVLTPSSVQLKTPAGSNLLVGPFAITIGGITVALSKSLGRDVLSKRHEFTMSNGQWSIKGTTRYTPYPKVNSYKTRMDVVISAIANVDSDPVAPHGLIGQTYDRDSTKVDGKVDNYDVPKNQPEITTTAMGEGGIEGTADDYVISRANPFSTSFKFSRYGLTSAPPRDATLLTGKASPAMSASRTGSAGAEQDVPVEDVVEY